jgi:hypothetical protein
MKTKVLIIILAVLTIIIAVSIWFFVRQNQLGNQNNISSNPIQMSVESANTASSTQTSQIVTSTSKIYRNEQFGFEFQYPQGWIILEEPRGLGFYSRFELVATPNMAESNNNPFLINVVLPEFADRTFLGVGGTTSTIIITGIAGIKYEYEFEGLSEIAIVLPFGQYKLILGTGSKKDYENVFNQMISTFKFLK